MLGLGMFAILFLATVLAVFLTLGAVRGDAERGLLQPLRRAAARSRHVPRRALRRRRGRCARRYVVARVRRDDA